MSDALSALTQTARNDNADHWTQPLVERQLAVLAQLADAGLELALAIQCQATNATATPGPDDPPPVVQGDIAMAYARVARAVRMTVLLQSRLIKELQFEEGSAKRMRRLEVAQEADARTGLENARKARIERIVGRVAKAGHDDDAVERLVQETAERLDDDGLYGDVLSRPVSEIVALICKDLGLDPDWARLAEEAWARGEIDSGEAAAPLAALAAGAWAAEPLRPPPHAASP